MRDRIVITGAGVISAIGCGKTASWESISHLKSGIAKIEFLDTELDDMLAGEVKISNDELAGELGADSSISRTSLLGIWALREALLQAGIDDVSEMPLICGTTVGGMDLSEKFFPEYSAKHDCGASSDDIASYFSKFSFTTTLSTACSAAANAVIFGANLIRAGICRRVAVGGSECLSNFHLNGFNSLMILDNEPCSPFDKDRKGLNLGEGAGYMILEAERYARERGAEPVAILSGYGNACDAFHQTASSENGDGAFLAMSKALASAGLNPEDIDYINAHGTGTPNNDRSESNAIKRLFQGNIPPVSSTKSYTGHTTSASGSIEAVFCLLAIEHRSIPIQLNWNTPDENCIIPYTGHSEAPLNNIMCNAFGFGGNDSSLILSKYTL